MDCITARLTVYFEDPFWVGVLERQTGGRLTACKVTFGACPSDAEVYRWLLKSWHTLHFSPPVKGGPAGATVRNPKRMQRIARQETTRGIGTKAQQALQMQREAAKAACQVRTRTEKEAEIARRFAQKQQKRREKHRGH